ncbi:hypothetical protein C2845_PM01G14770 [Panicum miliaceum]|uniref:Uncharacterized protein n=1 Tax=Panicum miliaceum TaxID=4540 RepID=A0A3L6TMK4_PANMI|nr:hypothetical protein C2845_PM01G14770 [Panicum miliaceum]
MIRDFYLVILSYEKNGIILDWNTEADHSHSTSADDNACPREEESCPCDPVTS